jgi:hypothetical protein
VDSAEIALLAVADHAALLVEWHLEQSCRFCELLTSLAALSVLVVGEGQRCSWKQLLFVIDVLAALLKAACGKEA